MTQLKVRGQTKLIAVPATFINVSKLAVVFCLAICCIINPATAFGTVKTANSSANWNTAGTWTPSGVPTASDTVVITGRSVTISNTNAVCKRLILEPSGGGNGYLYLNNGYDLAVGGDFIMRQNGNNRRLRLYVQGTGSQLTVSGNMSVTQDGENYVRIRASATNTSIVVTGNCTFTRSSPGNVEFSLNLTGNTSLFDVGGNLNLVHTAGGGVDMDLNVTGINAILRVGGTLDMDDSGGAGIIYIYVNGSGAIDANGNIDFTGVTAAGNAEIRLNSGTSKLYMAGNFNRNATPKKPRKAGYSREVTGINSLS